MPALLTPEPKNPSDFYRPHRFHDRLVNFLEHLGDVGSMGVVGMLCLSGASECFSLGKLVSAPKLARLGLEHFSFGRLFREDAFVVVDSIDRLGFPVASKRLA